MARSKSICEQAGQALILGFDGATLAASTRGFIQQAQPGGVILFARNLETPQQTHALLKECRSLCSAPMFLCVDMEGGTVDRLKNIFSPAPAAATVFAARNNKHFRQHGHLIGAECRALGFNVDFAPVFDLALPPSKSVLGSRAVSASGQETVTYAREFLRGLHDAKVLGCGKHFPGLGEADLDTHKELPAINKSSQSLWEQDLHPYRMLRRDCDFVMVAHALYPRASRDELPASLSPHWMEAILRKKIGYRGLIISDDLEMGGVLAAASIEDAAVQCIAAGADMFLVCHKEEMVLRAYEAVVKMAEQDACFRKKLSTAARRVMGRKLRQRSYFCFPPAPNLKTIARLKNKMQAFSETFTNLQKVDAS